MQNAICTSNQIGGHLHIPQTHTHVAWRCWRTLNETWHDASKLSASICCRFGQDNSAFNNSGEMAKMLKLHWNWHMTQRINTRTSPLKCFLCQPVVVVMRCSIRWWCQHKQPRQRRQRLVMLVSFRIELNWGYAPPNRLDVHFKQRTTTIIISNANANVHVHATSCNNICNNNMYTIIKKQHYRSGNTD